VADQPPAPLALVPGRECGACTMCCQVLRIEELAKPELTACRHLGQHLCATSAGGGCGIYDTRPEACREFYCGYRALPFVGAHWFPRTCGMMVYPMASEKRLTVHVDPATPDAWRAEPFASDIRKWAEAARTMGMRLDIAVGREIIPIA
jgi:uncharacterized protein